jgi:hypothetical protein
MSFGFLSNPQATPELLHTVEAFTLPFVSELALTPARPTGELRGIRWDGN